MQANIRHRQCPECDHTITLVGTEAQKTAVNCTACGDCGTFLVENDDGTMRLMTTEEIASLPDQERNEMLAMRRHLARKKDGGPSIMMSDDRIAALVDGATPEHAEVRMMASELLARRARDLGPVNCPSCNSPNVSLTIVDDHFNYGVPPNTVLLCARDVEILNCHDCGQFFSGLQAEQKRAAAVSKHLAKSKQR